MYRFTFVSILRFVAVAGALALTLALVTSCGGSIIALISPNSLLFLHHSVGDGLIVEGNMRAAVTAYNALHDTTLALWDHGYNADGLRDPTGHATGSSYNIPGDNTDPDGLHALWTSPATAYKTCRNTLLDNHRVIAFKSCFTASDIADDAQLQQYKDWYLAMRDVFDAHPDHVFVVMSPPPLHRLSTTPAAAARARAFASWLSSDAYLQGHANVRCYNLFNALAQPDDGSPTANMLLFVYERDHADGDSHPNTLANQTVGPLLANFLCAAAGG